MSKEEIMINSDYDVVNTDEKPLIWINEEILRLYDLKKENEKLNHYKLLYQKVKERNDRAIKIMEDYTLFDLKAEKVMEVINLLKGNEE